MTLSHWHVNASYAVLSVARDRISRPYGAAMITAAELKEELAKPGRSQAALARFMRLDQASVNRICSGNRQIKVPELEQIEAYLTATSGGLASPLPSGAIAAQMLHIRYRVQAGAWLEANAFSYRDYGEGPIPPDPRIPPDAQWLEEVVGESMNRLFPSGTLVHVVDAVAINYTPRDGDLVVLERTRYQGSEIERSVKQIHMVGRRVEFRGNSTQDEFNEPILFRDGSKDDTVVRIAGWVKHAVLRFYHA